MPRSAPAPDGHLGHANRRTRGRGAHVEVAPDGIDALPQEIDVERYRHLAHRKRKRAILDPEAAGTPREGAGHGVEAKTHHLGHVETTSRAADDGFVRIGPRLQDEIGRARTDRGPTAAPGAGRARTTQLAT